MAVTSLEDTVRSLEQKCIDAEENNINLKKEMEELRELEKASIKKKEEVSHKSTQTTFQTSYKEIQTALENEGKKLKLLLLLLNPFISTRYTCIEAFFPSGHQPTIPCYSLL